MRNIILAGATALALLALAVPASAGVVFNSTFDGLQPYGTWSPVASADGWTGAPHMELQNHVAGSPSTGASTDVFVELDANFNSSMYRTIAAGTYDLSFLYSPRPGIGADSNGISVFAGGDPLSLYLNGSAVPAPLTANGGGDTLWNTYTAHFTVTADTTLSFAAVGTSDSLGGYLDNIKLETAAVPEPATWAMMIFGFGAIGSALRNQRRRPAAAFFA